MLPLCDRSRALSRSRSKEQSPGNSSSGATAHSRHAASGPLRPASLGAGRCFGARDVVEPGWGRYSCVCVNPVGQSWGVQAVGTAKPADLIDPGRPAQRSSGLPSLSRTHPRWSLARCERDECSSSRAIARGVYRGMLDRTGKRQRGRPRKSLVARVRSSVGEHLRAVACPPRSCR